MITDATFIQSGCQDFTQSACQNRNNPGTAVGFNFVAVAASTSPAVTSGFNGVLIAYDTFHSNQYNGVLNSIAVDGSGNAKSWNINWTTAFNPSDIPPSSVKVGSYNGFYSNQYLNFGLQGPRSKIYGTLAWHLVVSTIPGLDGWTYARAYSSYQRDWSTRFDEQNTALLAVPPLAYNYAMAFWMGKTPAQLPTGNFTFESFGLGRI